MEYHEVAVVGGGPAGSICSTELAKNGVDVVLFDHSHPREKPCGGAITGRIFKEFNIPNEIIERRVDWLILENQNGESVRIHKKDMGIFVMRKKFDYYWLKEAIKTNLTFYEEKICKISKDKNNWVLKTNKRKIKSKLLIGADGCSSLVRKTVLKPIPKILLGHCVGYHLPHKKEHIEKKFLNALELYFLGKPYTDTGYIWIFPKSDYVTVGIGAKLGTKNLKESLDKFISLHPASKRLSKEVSSNLHSHLIPYITDYKFFDLPTSGKNWILIGDAAGHVNPISEEGIYYAMTGGKLAAKAYLEGDIKLFEKYWRNKYGGDLYYGARFHKWFFKTSTIGLLIKLSQKNNALKDILYNIINPSSSYDKMIFNKFLPDALKVPFNFLINF